MATLSQIGYLEPTWLRCFFILRVFHFSFLSFSGHLLSAAPSTHTHTHGSRSTTSTDPAVSTGIQPALPNELGRAHHCTLTRQGGGTKGPPLPPATDRASERARYAGFTTAMGKTQAHGQRKSHTGRSSWPSFLLLVEVLSPRQKL